MSGGQKCRGTCWCQKDLKTRFEHYRPMLQKLSTAPVKEREAILKRAPSCLIKLLSECGLNVLKGNVKLTDHQYARLKPHRRLLLHVSRPTASVKERRDALVQKKGGFLPIILPMLLSALSGFAGKSIAKAVGLD